jgi:hypothetical protein
MARVKINRELALKSFVESLVATFGDREYTRSQVEQIGKSNGVGQTAFASKTNGYGELTRLGQGTYSIPKQWNSGTAPWTGVVADSPAPVNTTKPSKPSKAQKSKTPKAKTVEVTEAPPKKNVAVKKVLSKKELMEKAKEVLATKKAKAVAVAP